MKESIKKSKQTQTIEAKWVGVFVKDKYAANDYCGYLFKQGYSICTDSFICKSSRVNVKVIPMDADCEGIANRYQEFSFDEIIVPSNIHHKWDSLARSRLKSLHSVVKMYTR